MGRILRFIRDLQQQGRLRKKIILGLSIAVLILMVGMLVLSVSAAAMAKEPSAEELVAAAQAFIEAQQEGRLMECFILSLSIVVPLLMVVMFVSSLVAAVVAKESGAEELALWRGEAAAGSRAAASPPAIGDLQQQGRLMKEMMKESILGLGIVILILMVGMLVVSVSAAAMAKEPSAEELAAAAQAFNEAQKEGRLMEWFI